MTAQPVILGSTDPRANLEYEERQFNELRNDPAPRCLFYFCTPSVIIGRGNKPEEWADAAAAEADGIPVIRRFSGGGAVYLNEDVLNYSFTLPREFLGGDAVADYAGSGGDTHRGSPTYYIAVFRGLVIRSLSGLGGEWSATGTSDISLNGRKISGNAQRISAGLVLHHGTLMLRCPLAEINRYLPIPPNRPGVPHSGFVTGLAEEGLSTDVAELTGLIQHGFAELVELVD